MRKLRLVIILLLLLTPAVPEAGQKETAVLDEVLRLERAALDRWIRRDPQGYLDLYAPEITYFDPFSKARLDGIDAMTAMVAPLRTMPNPVTERRYEMIGARVQQYGEVAILTFQVVNYGKVQGAPESVLNRWNSTETYRRVGGRWRIVHSHWSFTTPAIAKP